MATQSWASVNQPRDFSQHQILRFGAGRSQKSLTREKPTRQKTPAIMRSI
jgi:hypothetical protein